MKAIIYMMSKEIRDGLRNRWVFATTLLLLMLALSLGFLGSSTTGEVKVDPLTVTVVSLSSLSVYLIPLIALLLSFDAIVGEVESGTMSLLLSYPISRWQVLVGKFLGHLTILSAATIVGYGLAGAVLQLAGGGLDFSVWMPFVHLIVASILLGASFLAIGYLVSSMTRERAATIGIVIAVWIFFVVIFDMVLLGVLIADTQHAVSASAVNIALLFNPTDVYRLLNLTGYENIALYSGMGGISEQLELSRWVLVVAQLLWIVIPFCLAVFRFRSKQI